MAMNWGAFAGALGQSALSTYERLGEEEMRELQRKKFRQEQSDEDALRAALRDAPTVKGTGGIAVNEAVEQNLSGFTPEQRAQITQDLAKMPVEQQQAVLRAYGGTEYANGAIDLSKIGVYKNPQGQSLATSDYKPLSQSERWGEVLTQMQNTGNLAGAQKALQFKTLFRDSAQQDQFDQFTDRLREVQTLVDNGDAKTFVDRLNKEGMNVKLVQGKDGATAIQYAPKGKPAVTFNSLQEAGGALNEMLTTQMIQANPSLFGDMKALAAYQQQREKLRQGDRELEIKAADAASSASYRAGMLEHHKESLAQQGKYQQGVLDNQNRTYDLNAQGITSPYGKDEQGRVVFSNNRTGALTYQDGSKVPPDAKVSSSAEVIASTRQAGSSPLSRATDLAEVLLGAGEVNPRTGKPFASMDEAKVHAYRMMLKDSGSKQLTEAQKIAYPKFLEAVEALGPKATEQQLILTAKKFGLPSSITGLPEATATAAAIGGDKDFEKRVNDGGKSGPKTSGSSSSAPTSALPPGYTRVEPSNAPSPAQLARGLEMEDLERRISTMSSVEAKEFMRTTQFLTLPGPLKAEIRRKADPRVDTAPRGLYIQK